MPDEQNIFDNSLKLNPRRRIRTRQQHPYQYRKRQNKSRKKHNHERQDESGRCPSSPEPQQYELSPLPASRLIKDPYASIEGNKKDEEQEREHDNHHGLLCHECGIQDALAFHPASAVIT